MFSLSSSPQLPVVFQVRMFDPHVSLSISWNGPPKHAQVRENQRSNNCSISIRNSFFDDVAQQAVLGRSLSKRDHTLQLYSPVLIG